MNRALGIVLEKKQQMMSGELLNEIDDTSADFVEFILVSRGSGPGPSKYPRVLVTRFLKLLLVPSDMKFVKLFTLANF